ncbi:MAG TPA: PF20097 family protein [Myxococcota bacterium]|nr:PF20097 family protein [Myxococcota bacterium]
MDLKCPKCDKAMEQAFVRAGVIGWCPEKGYLALKGRERLNVEGAAEAWRCRDCKVVLIQHS